MWSGIYLMNLIAVVLVELALDVVLGVAAELSAGIVLTVGVLALAVVSGERAEVVESG